MKPQDIIFIILLGIVILRRAKEAWLAGIVATILAGLLFLIGNLFTAQRLTWYAAAFFLVTVLAQALTYMKRN